MLKKILIPAALAVAVLGAVAPAEAQRYRTNNRGSGIRGSHEQRVADRARSLYNSGRLSRGHYEQTLANLRRGSGARWASQVDRTVSAWSRSDSRIIRDRRRRGVRTPRRY